MARTTLKVTGMTCGHCVDAVQGSLEQVQGVRSARIDLGAGRAVIDYDDALTGPRELAVAVVSAGYEAEEAT